MRVFSVPMFRWQLSTVQVQLFGELLSDLQNVAENDR